MKINVYESDNSDLFDFVPDPIVLHIFNKVSDIKTLTRCRSVSKRFNSLAPQSESLLLRVDRVISATDSGKENTFFLSFLRSFFKSFHCFVSPKKQPVFSNPTRKQSSPVQILGGFESIRSLQIELPAGDLRLENGSTIKWEAHYGSTLKSCVILGFGGGAEMDFIGSGLKTRVVWTISALIAASARHYLVLDVIKEQSALTNLVVKDKNNEGIIVMDKIGLKECRLADNYDEELINDNLNNNTTSSGMGIWNKSNRTKVPAVQMRMRHEATIELSNGVKLEGATLVVVTPKGGGYGGKREEEEEEEQSSDVGLAMEAFGRDSVYKEAVDKLLKSKTYILEMNTF